MPRSLTNIPAEFQYLTREQMIASFARYEDRYPKEALPPAPVVTMKGEGTLAAGRSVRPAVTMTKTSFTKKQRASNHDAGRYISGSKHSTNCTQCRLDGILTVLPEGSDIIAYEDDQGRKQIDCTAHYK